MLELANRAMVAVVTPYVGVWIEMKRNPGLNGIRQVTPYVGVWIEINSWFIRAISSCVTPYVGVWIEMKMCMANTIPRFRHPLCGGVD